MTRPAPRRPLLRMLAGAALISSSGVWVTLAEVPPSTSAFYRMLFGGLFLLLWIGLSERRIPRFRGAAPFLLAALFFALDLVFWHRSILYIGPGLSTLLANFQVFVLAAVGVALLGERLSGALLAGLGLSLLGLWLLVGMSWQGFDAVGRAGVGFGLLTALAYAAYLLTMRWAQGRVGAVSPQEALCLTSFLCALWLAGVLLAEGHGSAGFVIPSLASLGALLSYGLVAQVAGWVLIVSAMPYLRASVVGLMLLLQPALAFVWDMLLFSRPTSGWDLAGLGLALAGIYLGSRRPAPKQEQAQ